MNQSPTVKPSWHGHYIGHNHSCERPQRFVFVDVETSQEVVKTSRAYTKHTLKLGVACFVDWKHGSQQRETWFDFEHAVHFWEWLKKWQRKKSVLWVVAHNAAFDLTILDLWKRLETSEYSTVRPGKEYRDPSTLELRTSAPWHGLTAIDGCPFHVETEGPGGRVNFTDLQNYYQCSLAEIGTMVGIEKGKWDDVKQSDNDLRFYCHNDVEILKRAYLGLLQRWQDNDCGNWKFSAAGLAWTNYRHRYMTEKIAVHNNKQALDLEWSALYGGEVRAWFRGCLDRPLLHVDVNSLYPSVMVDGVYPTALIDVLCRPSRRQLETLCGKYAAVAHVELRTTRDYYPVRVGNRISYPIGKFTTTLAGPELLTAIDRGEITECDWLAIYTHANIFKTFVLDWWEQKRSAKARGDYPGEKFAKLILNSLSAKFAQRSPQWKYDPRIDVVRPWKTFPYKCPDNGSIYPARSLGWLGQVARHRVASEHAFPAIYAYVTAYARERMRELRSSVPPSCLFYQDTDSLIVDSEAYNSGLIDNWVIGDGLGQLRVVGEYSHAEFRGPKNYTIDGRHVIAGVRKRDVELAPMLWESERFERTTHLFNRGPDSTLRTYRVNVDTPGSDSEGGVRADGFTKPLILPDGYDMSYLIEMAALAKNVPNRD